jgi:prevent-host-death family protein
MLEHAIERDYNGHMITTLREGKAKLSELVDRASRGEDVLITVRGKIKARLTKAEGPRTASDNAKWAQELRELQRSVATRRKPRVTIEEILDDLREDRF